MIPTSLLVIDDNNDSNTLIKFVLEQDTDWRILTATDGEEGVALAQLQQPSVIVLDLMMPRLSGLEVYQLLKSNPTTHSIPIILMTAMVKMKPITKSQIGEDVEVILKPFNIMTFKERIISACDRYLTTEAILESSDRINEPKAR